MIRNELRENPAQRKMPVIKLGILNVKYTFRKFDSQKDACAPMLTVISLLHVSIKEMVYCTVRQHICIIGF